MSETSSNKQAIRLLWLSILLLIIGICFLIHVPYYAMQPGDAIDTGTVISVDGGYTKKAGDFFLTTVAMKQANVFDYLLAKVNKKIELVPVKEVLAEDENDKQYEQQQVENMLESQHSAVIAAFHQSKKPYRVTYKGIEVLGVTPGAKNHLKNGDIIQSIDGKATLTTHQLMDLFRTKKAGDKVSIGVLRANKKVTEQATLISLDTGNNKVKRVGLGFLPMDRLLSLTSNPKVNFKTNNIGGPSAGLMFTLEILNQLTPKDLTHGYEIAGTGTISPTGAVGQIGGIQHKIAAAMEKNATIFFTPKDIYEGDDNEAIAKKTAKELGANMKIVPVATLQEAIDYLNKLK
ncbi:PDZ domain-containing protein [Shimazuella sp. AN120528]|uniref:SepM family pheromone-processing serine protease n=1 Tax=Shimazuella soli TaxID=1892854 RepID=UPI001F1007DA|nr:SepM family pheromone-processing serine protease [Shimazuella soli]MCH5584957.1 PDZ domain-containing protein [Shimazuella soli]